MPRRAMDPPFLFPATAITLHRGNSFAREGSTRRNFSKKPPGHSLSNIGVALLPGKDTRSGRRSSFRERGEPMTG